jgi:hypothetical protein
MENVGKVLKDRVRVCRGVLRFWGPPIQDSRTDFWAKTRKSIDSTSMRGWCKMGILIREYYKHMETTNITMKDWGNIRINKIVYGEREIDIILYRTKQRYYNYKV